MFEYTSASPGVAICFVFPLTIKERNRWIGWKACGLRLALWESTFFFILSQSDGSVSSIILGLERPHPWWLKTPLLCRTGGVPWDLCIKGLVPSLGCYRNLAETFKMWGLMRGFRSWEVVPLKGIVGHRPLPRSLWLASAMRQTGFLHHTLPQWSALLPWTRAMRPVCHIVFIIS